jgi:predicted ATPase
MENLAAVPEGERAEIAVARAALAGDARVVTVTGPVGVGKSFVARAAAIRAARDRVVEDVVAIDLAGATTLEAVLVRVARALALAHPSQLDAASEARRVARALELRGQVLMVLDGVDDARADVRGLVGEWLELALEARFATTTRERLAIREEHVVEIPPLSVPRGDELDGPAAAFFLACVRRTQPKFAPLPADAPLLAEIVRELDGLPLALELAAPRLAVMGPAALLHRLRSSRSVLRARAPAAGDPHRSFDAALEGSWLALQPWERTALAALTAFASFDLEDAEAVIDLNSQPAAPRVLDVIEALRDKSLVATLGRGAAGEVRLRLLASIADFVRRRADPAECSLANARHAHRYGEIARRLASGPRTAPNARAVVRDADGENLLAVIRRALAMPTLGRTDAERALWALLALAPGLEPRTELAAHARILERVLDATQGSGAEPVLMARALSLRGALRRRQGDLAGALRDLGGGLHLARTCGDLELEGVASIESAALAEAAGDLEAARTQAQEAVRCLAGAGANAEETRALLTLARTERARGELAAAKAIALRALSLAEARGFGREERLARLALADFYVDLGALDDARAQTARVRAAIDAAAIPACDRLEGGCFHEEGDLQRALARYAASAALARRLGLPEEEARALVLRGIVAMERRSFAEAYAELAIAAEIAEGSLRGLADGLRAAAARLDADAGAATRSPVASPIAALDRAIVELATAASSPASYATARAKVVASFGTHSLARLAVRAFDRCLAVPGRAIEPPRDAFVVGPKGRWFRTRGGEAVSLERRRPLAALLDRLVAARQADPGGAVSWSDLLEAAWPGERILAEAGVHRVRVALSTLRKLGLRDLLITTADGYALDRACPLFRVEEPLAP